jgi:hypothetical protein
VVVTLKGEEILGEHAGSPGGGIDFAEKREGTGLVAEVVGQEMDVTVDGREEIVEVVSGSPQEASAEIGLRWPEAGRRVRGGPESRGLRGRREVGV